MVVGAVALWYFFFRKKEEFPLCRPAHYLTNEQANNYANILYDAMNQLGTEEERVNWVYNQIVNSDNESGMLRDIVFAFGRRPYFVYRAGLDISLLGGSVGYPYTLLNWISEEMNKTEVDNWTWLYRRAGLIK